MINNAITKPKRKDYIQLMRHFMDFYGDGYSHLAITGHFGGGGVEFTNRTNENIWQKHQKDVRTFFRKVTRKFNKDRDWRRREGTMGVLLYPEIQQNLHFHGVLAMPRTLTDMQLWRLNSFCDFQWERFFRKGHFNIDEMYSGGWAGYTTKKCTVTPFLKNNFELLPPA